MRHDAYVMIIAAVALTWIVGSVVLGLLVGQVLARSSAAAKHHLASWESDSAVHAPRLAS